jgi:hypothetical protein
MLKAAAALTKLGGKATNNHHAKTSEVDAAAK